MGDRGRKSTAELSVASTSSIQRPTAPKWLSADEKKEWKEVTKQMPPEWATRERFALVESYCTHAVSRRKAAEKLAECWDDPDIDPKVAKTWSDIHGKDSGQLKSLAIRLEIAQSTSYERNRRAKKPKWES